MKKNSYLSDILISVLDFLKKNVFQLYFYQLLTDICDGLNRLTSIKNCKQNHACVFCFLLVVICSDTAVSFTTYLVLNRIFSKSKLNFNSNFN